MTDGKYRQVRVPEALFLRVMRAAAREQAETSKRVSVVSWIRGAIEDRLSDVERPRYVPPAGHEVGR